MIRRLAWATSTRARGHDPDEQPVVAAMSAAGVVVDVVAWDDPAAEWSGHDRVVIRSTWGYQHRVAQFLGWLDAVDAVTDLRNPLPMLRWSLDKHYLADLDSAGIPVIPTVFVEPGQGPPVIREEVVVKPSVGASSHGVRIYPEHRAADVPAHIARLHAGGASALVQPRLPSVARTGEYPLVFLAGRYSHAVLRRVTAGPDGANRSERSRPHRAGDEQLAVAGAAMDYIASRFGTPTYARLDLVTDPAGSVQILEVELVEPSLFIPEGGPDAVSRLAAALTARP